MMILIAVASAAILYSYVFGLIGSDSTSANSADQSMITINQSCVSISNKCDVIYGYFVVVRNDGAGSLGSGNAQIYFSDLSTGSTSVGTCILPSIVNTGATYSCGS
ncbi:MAG: hypothetical protein OK439_05135 [Thaumarchaeota archaeon]|nr:hypothetical protein [Nitrososphaerota archaeon]